MTYGTLQKYLSNYLFTLVTATKLVPTRTDIDPLKQFLELKDSLEIFHVASGHQVRSVIVNIAGNRLAGNFNKFRENLCMVLDIIKHFDIIKKLLQTYSHLVLFWQL